MSYRYLPDYINGDFDSITADVSNFYKEKVRYKILKRGGSNSHSTKASGSELAYSHTKETK